MKIAILGAGFTGLTAAYRLLQKGYEVTVFEKEDGVGGLSGGFKLPAWDWSVEKYYHHFFTSDLSALKLAKEINHKIYTKRPKTDVFLDQKIIRLDSPSSLLKFPRLSLLDKARVAITLAYLKLNGSHKRFENINALPWIKKWMGKRITGLIWEPLFWGKFGSFKDDIALTWFWARIKKRTPSLAYPEGGFQNFAEKLAEEIKKLGGQILLNSEVLAISRQPSAIRLKTSNDIYSFEKIIVTIPTPIFTKITPFLPSTYVKKVSSIPHLFAQALVLVLDKPFLKNTYWLNITDTDFPFLVVAQHSNFMSSKHYNNRHILYIGNYLPEGHPYLKMSAGQLLKIFTPYLKKINPGSHQSPITSHLFSHPFAQPVTSSSYPKLIPSMKTPLKNIYLANMDMVYPWDRGSNYAIELGEKVAAFIDGND